MSILHQFKLDGKTALVTGCKSGIGKAMAIALAEAGAEIVGVSATLETEGSAERDFDWRVYADATCAGLSVLVPIPLVDLLFEHFFERRMAATICRARGVDIGAEALASLGRRRGPLITVRGCLMLPVSGGLYLLKRISRKILYFLTVREATEQLSRYWHRAYLVDHMVVAGLCQAPPGDLAIATDALEATLGSAETSPLLRLARATVGGAHRVLRMLVRARRSGPGPEVHARARELESHWLDVSAHFEQLAERYERTRAELASRPPARGGR